MYAIKIMFDGKWIFVHGPDTGYEPLLFDNKIIAEESADCWRFTKKAQNVKVVEYD